jgi:uncharacterized membrane protein HdeD (DUF308 family)
MTADASTAETTSPPRFSEALRRLYLVRFVFAVVWAGLLFATGSTEGPVLTTLLVAYPLFDAGAVLWQVRAERDSQEPTATEWVNVVISLVVAVALGVASASSISAALVVWGAWAIAAGVPQLITAVRNRRSGGQVAQMLSGGISVLAGAAFLGQGAKGEESIGGAGGYALFGGILFLVSAIRLTSVLRPKHA